MGRATTKKRKVENKGNRSNRPWLLLWALLVALVAILIMIIWSITNYSITTSVTQTDFIPPSLTRETGYGKQTDEVKRIRLSSPDKPFAKTTAEKAIPVVIRNSIVSKWRARKWTPTYLKSKFKVLTGIYQNDNRWFGPYYDHNKPLLEYSTRINSYETNKTLPSDKFFRLLESPRENNFLYFTGGIEQLGGWANSEIVPINELLALNPKRSSINAWIGQPRVIAHCHYDGYHNFYAQLYGKKKFVLFSPTNWPGLYPYPFLHPSHAQAQVNASNPENVERFKLVRKVEYLEVILEPGDLLYIPPLWFHEVESLSVSISVNVWTDSHQTELAERIFSLPLPFDSNYGSSHGHEHVQWQDNHTRRIGSVVLIFRMLERICKYRNCTSVSRNRFLEISKPSIANIDMIKQLWSTRYRDLMEKRELPNSYLNGGYILCEGEGDGGLQVVIETDADILRDVHFGAYVEEVSHLLRGLPDETWELWLGNYVEYIAANVLSNVKYVGLYLKYFSTCAQHLE